MQVHSCCSSRRHLRSHEKRGHKVECSDCQRQDTRETLFLSSNHRRHRRLETRRGERERGKVAEEVYGKDRRKESFAAVSDGHVYRRYKAHEDKNIRRAAVSIRDAVEHKREKQFKRQADSKDSVYVR